MRTTTGKMQRPDRFYMGIAYEISTASRAKTRRVGAILVKDDNIVSFGYNGTPRGFSNECEGADKLTKPEVLHAESNAITKCAQSTLSSTGAELFVTTAPCFNCAKLIIQAGIISVFYAEDYHDLAGIELLKHANITVIKIVYNGK